MALRDDEADDHPGRLLDARGRRDRRPDRMRAALTDAAAALPGLLAARPGDGDGDDRLHDRQHLGDDDPVGPPSLRHRRAVAGHRLRALDGGVHRPRRAPRRRHRPQAHRRDRDRAVRRRVARLRADARHRDRRGVADPVPRPAGDRRRPPDPLGDGPRPRRVPDRRARQGPRGLLHRRRAVHGDRADRGLVSDRVLDLAGDLLDQRPGRPVRADRALAQPDHRRQASVADRRPRRRRPGRGNGARRARDPAVDGLGMGQPGDDRLDRRRPAAAGRVRPHRTRHREPADRRPRAARRIAPSRPTTC